MIQAGGLQFVSIRFPGTQQKDRFQRPQINLK